MSILDDLYRVMLAEVGDSHQAVPDLWKRYLASLGYFQPTVLGQMQAFASDNGMAITAALEYVASGAAGSGTPANLIGNGTFADTTIWTAESGWSISAGQASHASGSGGNIHQPIAFVSGGTYEVTYTVASISGGTVNCRFIAGSGANVTGSSRSTPGTYVQQLVAGDHTIFAINAAALAVATIDDVIMTRVS